MSDENVFTREELTAAARRTPFPDPYLGVLAVMCKDALAHREPDYIDGGMYEDDDGSLYMFCAEYDDHPDEWAIPGEQFRVRLDVPVRPMWPMKSTRRKT